jgi:glycerophosphoryl diester phosphodiesterase
MFAIRRAVELGATGIELDVHASADGHLVVCHDETVDRTTNGSGRISTLTLAELKALDNAYWFVPGADVTPGLDATAYPYRGRAPQDGDFAVATLDEVLDLLGGHPSVAVNLDIKSSAPTVEPYEGKLAAALADHGSTDRVIVASFLDPATQAFARLAPDVAISAGTLATANFWRAVHAGEALPPMPYVALQVPTHQGDLVIVDEQFVDAAHRSDLAVHVWTINDAQEMQRLVALGVDGIISDVPTILVGALQEGGATYQP